MASLSIGQSNEGTNFWFGFMEHVDVNDNEKVAMITSQTNTTGIISLPNTSWIQNFTVEANEVILIPLPNEAENVGSEMVRNVGVNIQSIDPVSVYIHQYHQFRSEATVVLPNSSLGNEYYAMTYRGLEARDEFHPSEFLLVAISDNTEISVQVEAATKGGKASGSNFSVNLDRGETYQVQASGVGDLTGSLVRGDKDFAMFAGNSWTEVPADCSARDNLLEQMYPLETWGKKIVVVPNAQVNFDVVRLMGSVDGTNVNIYGSNGVITQTVNNGEFAEINITEAKYIEADSPIQVAQFNVGQDCGGHNIGDPSMVLLNSVTQTRDTVTLFNSSLQNIVENYINIISLTSDLPFITFDGQEIPANAEMGTVGPNNEYTFIRLQVSAGAHTIISEACGVIAAAYGYGDAESYAYSGGASFNAINTNPIPDGGCLNDTIIFDANLPEPRYSFLWDLGNGETYTSKTFERIYDELGEYPVELVITDECLGTVDTFNRQILVSLRQAVEARGDTTLCALENLSLGASDLVEASYVWQGPNNYYSEDQFPIIENVDPLMTGTYSVIGIISGCATFPQFSEVEVVPLPQPDLGPDTIFCSLEEGKLLTPGSFDSYLWQDDSNTEEISALEQGSYSVTVENDFGCSASDIVLLTEICPTKVFVPNIFSPNDDGFNDTFQVLGDDILSMHLKIYDRWGNFIYQTTSQAEPWDGSFKGQKSAAGLYIWTLEVEGYSETGDIFNEVRQGDFYLMR